MKLLPVLIYATALFAIMCLAGALDASAHGRRGTIPYCLHHARDLAKRKCVVRVVFHSAGQSNKAVRVGMCESNLNPRAWSEDGSYYGAFQFGASEREAYNYGHTIVTQARAARRMYDARGWSPWPRCGRL